MRRGLFGAAGPGRNGGPAAPLWRGRAAAMTFFVGPAHALTLRLILIDAVAWALAGLAFGALTWSWCEWRYRKLVKSRARQ